MNTEAVSSETNSTAYYQSSPAEKENVIEKTPSSKHNFFGSIKSFMINKKKIIIPLVIILILLAVGVSPLRQILFKTGNNPPFSNNLSSQNKGKNIPGENYKIGIEFAKYNLVETPFKPALPDYTITISELYNLSSFEKASQKTFTDSQKNALTNTNFFIIQNTDKFWSDNLDSESGRTDDWTSLYGIIGGGAITERAPENSVFITSDFLLHVYHRLLEKEFEYIENKKFYPILKQMTDGILTNAIQNYSAQTDSDNRASYERIIAFFTVPKVILNSAFPELSANSTADQKLDTNENIFKNLETLKPTIPDFSYQKAKAELTLVLDANTIAKSPLYDEFLSKENLAQPVDYTQFTPRSHYNKNSILRSYFRAMMWYGRTNFVLISQELTRDATNMSLLTKNAGQLENWGNIYIPTAFLVGKSDDLGINEYLTGLDNIDIASVTSDVITKVQSEMNKYQGPQIQSSVFIGTEVFNTTKEELLQKTKGFRFMGQRFTPDALIFTSLTQGDEQADTETGQKLPSFTTALMVMSSLGNKTADPLVANWISAKAPSSDKILNKNLNTLKNQFSKLSTGIWTQNIYWGWLYTIKSLYTGEIDKTGYPTFMKNNDWNLKGLQASLGSWTELKHDTLLYAKQAYAELGGGGEQPTPPPVPKGYVEPNILFFDRLTALASMTNDGLKGRNLIDSIFVGRNENFLKDLDFFKGIAVKELQNEKISDDDFETLRTKGKFMNYLLDALPGDQIRERDARSALIADVQTDIPDSQILYEADGIPNYIYVAVKDQNGTRLTKGLVFNYYEFYSPIAKRLTDQDWWTLNYTQNKSQLPAIPDWTQSLYK